MYKGEGGSRMSMTASMPDLGAAPDAADLRGLHRLAGAILLQAIEDIRFRSGKTREEALQWVQSDSEDQFSFVFCCRILERDPDEVRRFLERRDVLQWLFSAARQPSPATL